MFLFQFCDFFANMNSVTQSASYTHYLISLFYYACCWFVHASDLILLGCAGTILLCMQFVCAYCWFVPASDLILLCCAGNILLCMQSVVPAALLVPVPFYKCIINGGSQYVCACCSVVPISLSCISVVNLWPWFWCLSCCIFCVLIFSRGNDEASTLFSDNWFNAMLSVS